jgi:acyl-coenzyme A thioesterase PaaI-like protein
MQVFLPKFNYAEVSPTPSHRESALHKKRINMAPKAFQDYYPDYNSHCYGCGRLNKDGLQIKSYWDGEESVCHFTPRPYQTGGVPNNLYGGLVASLMDCHGAGTAAAVKAKEAGIDPEKGPYPRFVTAKLEVEFLAPTPMDATLEVRGRVILIKGRKIKIRLTLSAQNKIRAKGEVLMIQLPENK